MHFLTIVIFQLVIMLQLQHYKSFDVKFVSDHIL